MALGIYKSTGEQVYRWASDEKVSNGLDLTKPNSVRIELADVFPEGMFVVNLYIRRRDRAVNYAMFDDIAKFEIRNSTPYQHATYWKIPESTIINGRER